MLRGLVGGTTELSATAHHLFDGFLPNFWTLRLFGVSVLVAQKFRPYFINVRLMRAVHIPTPRFFRGDGIPFRVARNV